MTKREYDIMKLKISKFIIGESVKGNVSDEKIARMLVEISLNYLVSSRDSEEN